MCDTRVAGCTGEGAPTEDVLRAFGCSGPPRRLEGGSRPAWAACALVFKRVYDAREWRWLGENLAGLPTPGIRLARPLPASDGRWIVEGWGAQELVPGRHPHVVPWLDVVRVGEALHRALRSLPRPEFIDARTDPWAAGDRVAWEEAPASAGFALLDRLLAARRQLEPAPRSQLVHGDLGGNVLFDAEGVPAVIDFSPYWRPPGFASAIVVADAVCWCGADPEVLCAGLSHVDHFAQLLVRALVYRIVTALVVSRGQDDLAGYRRCVGFAIERARARARA